MSMRACFDDLNAVRKKYRKEINRSAIALLVAILIPVALTVSLNGAYWHEVWTSSWDTVKTFGGKSFWALVVGVIGYAFIRWSIKSLWHEAPPFKVWFSKATKESLGTLAFSLIIFASYGLLFAPPRIDANKANLLRTQCLALVICTNSINEFSTNMCVLRDRLDTQARELSTGHTTESLLRNTIDVLRKETDEKRMEVADLNKLLNETNKWIAWYRDVKEGWWIFQHHAAMNFYESNYHDCLQLAELTISNEKRYRGTTVHAKVCTGAVEAGAKLMLDDTPANHAEFKASLENAMSEIRLAVDSGAGDSYLRSKDCFDISKRRLRIVARQIPSEADYINNLLKELDELQKKRDVSATPPP